MLLVPLSQSLAVLSCAPRFHTAHVCFFSSLHPAMPLVLPPSSASGLAENSLKLILTSSEFYVSGHRGGAGKHGAWCVQGCARMGICTDIKAGGGHPSV